jgi:hypothetical protein
MYLGPKDKPWFEMDDYWFFSDDNHCRHRSMHDCRLNCKVTSPSQLELR